MLVLPQPIIREMEEDPISSILHITDIGYYPKAWHHFRERQEPITQFVFIYCIEGSGWYRTEGRGIPGDRQPIFHPAGRKTARLRGQRGGPVDNLLDHFKGKLASHFARQCTRPVEIKPGMHSRISNRIDMFEEILRTLEMGYSHENLLYACSIFYHYLGTLRYLQQYRDAARHETEKNDIVTAAIHFMKENIEKKLTLQEIAAHTGYSSSHFSVLFSQRTGYAPLTYFNQLKIQQACQLLDFTDMKVNQVAIRRHRRHLLLLPPLQQDHGNAAARVQEDEERMITNNTHP